MSHTDAMKASLKAARDISAKAEAESRDFTDEERTAVMGHMKDFETAKKAAERKDGDDELRKSLTALGLELGLEQTPTGEKAAPETFAGPTRRKSIGELFVESPEYKAFMGQFPDGRIGEKARVQSMPVGYKALLTGASDTSAGAFVQTDYSGIVETLGRRAFTLRDIISVRQTGSDSVEYVRQTARTNAAASVAEATSSASPTSNTSTGAVVLNAGGGYKPEGGMTFEKVTATVKTIAEWVAATKRGLADAGQLRGLIDQELRDDLREEEEDQLVNGSGSGENLEGILTVSGTQSQAFATDIFTTTRAAKTKVRTVGRSMPTAYLMNPEDWEKFDVAKGSDGHFIGAGPFAVQGPTLWGLPVVESEAIAAGTAICADFRKAVLWDREQASVSVTDSHADFFIRNLVAVLAEERVAFGVTRPSAFVEIDLTA